MATPTMISEDDHNDLQEPLLGGNNNCSSPPYVNVGFFSTLTFSWIGDLISKGYHNTLDLEDVPSLSGKDNVFESFVLFRDYLAGEGGGGGSSSSHKRVVTSMQLMKSLIFITWVDIILSTFLCMVVTLADYVGPYFIEAFINCLNGKQEFRYQGYLLVSAFFIAKVVGFICHRHWMMRLGVVGIRAKAVLIQSIYDKALKLNCRSKQDHTSGEMINLMSIDAERVTRFIWYFHYPLMFTSNIVLALVILYKSLGLGSVATFVTMVVILFVNYPLTTLLEKYQKEIMNSKDNRIKATSEILKNMRILKLQAWEMKFLSKVVGLRNIENGWLKKFLYTSAVTTFLFWGFPTFVAVITFGTCTLVGTPLVTGKILSAIATFRILQGVIYGLPDMVSMMTQTKVSLDRVASFLSLDEMDQSIVERIPRANSEVAVEIIGGNFSWDQSPSASTTATLRDINLRVERGMKVAVCGTVGSGKSTLLSCILGEVPKISGAIRISGSKAYVPQSPWIQSGKIVDNILFGKEMDRERYDAILEACSLKMDLEVLSFGDQTVIGERGINLSGGQKQRIQLARALYQDADMYLFDDPFSAVDAHVGSHLFKECLLGLPMSKTVIYVTHQVEFLCAADVILVMKNGRISQAGKYNDILASGSDFMELVGAHNKALSSFNSVESEVINSSVDVDYIDEKAFEEEGEFVKADDMIEPNKGQLVQEEEREKGRVGLSVYWRYVTTAYGGALVPIILVAQILFQVLQIFSDYWMTWATPVSLDDAKPTVDPKIILLVYVGLAMGSAFCVLIRQTLLQTAALKTASSFFSTMHSCIFRAPMSFFDATPSGRILNRASTDQSAVDMNIASIVGTFAFSVIQLLAVVVVMSQVAWQVFVIFIPVTAISLWYQQYYIPSGRELSRLVGITNAPLIQHFSETISGDMTIRSFDQESRFCEISMNLVNGYSRPRFYNAAAVEWLSIRLDLLSSITFAALLIFVISIPVGIVDPSVASLSVTYGLTLTMYQGWMISNLRNTENKIISVERILQYTCVPSEPPLVIENHRPNLFWPSYGKVLVQNLQIRYAPHMPMVLRGITCTFEGGKKTGIVGRTGSGKSTLVQALFRIVEPAVGKIMLDGINISSIGLHDLRSKLSIIPQDPTLFEGTIRSNLDPIEEFSDEQIWEALDKCQLGDEVRKNEAKLDSIVTEGGENWSMGQRQLVCLGRVLLKRSKLLILDEATASVDTATDNLIQQTIRKHFSDSTVITIAHRITSVINSDMVVVLNNGVVEESDSPSRLLDNKSSSFAGLVAEFTTRSKTSLAPQ